MAIITVNVVETFVSLQGESTFAGRPCFFVRLAGCNLRCRYCDTAYAYEGGRDVAVADLAAEFAASGVSLAEITGGEPLLQAGCRDLALALRAAGAHVLVETNGSLDIAAIPDGVVAIMDIKCPGSGASEAVDWANIGRLRPDDQVKFVIGDRADFDWACDVVRQRELDRRCRAVLFSPVAGQLTPATLGDWVLASKLPVHLQVQLHKFIGMK